MLTICGPGVKLVARRLSDQQLDDEAVAPLAIELAVTLVEADLAEAKAAAEAATGLVLGEDAGHELVEAGRLAAADQLGERRPTGPLALLLAIGVDRVLDDALVPGPRAIGAGPGPGDHPSLAQHDHRRIAALALAQRGGDLLHRTRLALEGR